MLHPILPLLEIAAFLLFAVSSNAADTVQLSGEWRFALDPKDLGANAKQEEWRFPDKIKLPGALTAQGFGEVPSIRTKWTGANWQFRELFKEWQTDDHFKMPFFLQPPRQYVGPAWYQKDFEWQGGGAMLYLERVHWQSTVWLDGRVVGKGDSLGVPHEFDLGEVTKGKHTLTLRIDNRLAPVNVGPASHSVTDHTQGNWNGVVGRMELKRVGENRMTCVRAFPQADGTVTLRVSGKLAQRSGEEVPSIVVRDQDAGLLVLGRGTPTRQPDGTFEVEVSAKVGKSVRMWNEFTPNLYHLCVDLECGDDGPADRKTVSVGFRALGTKDGRITINGRKIFFRGTLECCIFPLTGYPPTDVESWKRIIRICKAHGLNHIRFHSWCPPEAAFVAADELGFYYQVEVSSWANAGSQIGSGTPLDAWIEVETKRMLDIYGNHPSFMLMAYGNEPGGNNHAKWLQDWVARQKAADPRRLYTTGAGWTIMPGSDFHSDFKGARIYEWGKAGEKAVINAQAPRTDFDWRRKVQSHADAPLISHEVGQWCVYPNFGEIGKYTGYFKAHNFEIFRETARRNGLLEQADDFLKASGKLQTLAYKHDIEAALRTPGFGGFQLLDLHDFPGQGTALVGVLDAFWDEKGYVKPEEFRRFCAPIVPLARMKKMVYQTNETLAADLEVAQFGPDDLKATEVLWSLKADDGTVIGEGKLTPRDLPTGDLHALGAIQVPLDKVKQATKAVFTVSVGRENAVNSWDIFIYPANPPAPVAAARTGKDLELGGVAWTDDLEVAKDLLSKGCKVLWLAEKRCVRNDAARPLVAGFSPIFWNTAWTSWQPPHTLGILCDPRHPALKGFPTDFYSNWQWWEIQQGAQPFILTKHPDLKPIIQLIDDWVTNRKLGYVFETKVGGGRLLACSAAIHPSKSSGKPAAMALFAALWRYAGSDVFNPALAMSPSDLDALAGSANAFFAMDTALRDNKVAGSADAQAALLKELGYAGIGASGYLSDEFLAAFDRQKLKVFNTYLTLDFDSAKPELDPKLKDFIARLKGRDTALWLAIGKVSKDGAILKPSDPAGDDIVLPRLLELAKLAQASGVRIALYPHTAFWLERMDDSLRILKMVKRANVGTTFNLCHWLKVEGDRDPKPVLKAASSLLFFVSINGADQGDTRAMEWNRLIQPLGKGSYQVDGLLRLLNELEYGGPIGFQGFGIQGDSREILSKTMTAWHALLKAASEP